MSTFQVRKGKWSFACEVQADTLSPEAKADIGLIHELLKEDVLVTKRVPEFYASYASTASFDQFNQFSTYLASRNRAGVATLSRDYWFILIPEEHLFKCMIVKRVTSPQNVEPLPREVEPIVPKAQLGLPLASPSVDTSAQSAATDASPIYGNLTPSVLDAMLGLQQLQAMSHQPHHGEMCETSPAPTAESLALWLHRLPWQLESRLQHLPWKRQLQLL
ncbi:hypothetical protein ACHHYP_20083 [Achlya hypogyna]|uniref:Spen paralogue and orthologue SPOC C-terminal domain-containing protein n=1 Tax=Achlya hypogyna TaxID=1202772 RepID=A0A1V9ZSL6_ACHHY|nr:hypothetical protein ACHHYP_20083 [Achlya hypogyna]